MSDALHPSRVKTQHLFKMKLAFQGLQRSAQVGLTTHAEALQGHRPCAISSWAAEANPLWLRAPLASVYMDTSGGLSYEAGSCRITGKPWARVWFNQLWSRRHLQRAGGSSLLNCPHLAVIDLQVSMCRHDKWSDGELHRDTITGEQSVRSGDRLDAYL